MFKLFDTNYSDYDEESYDQNAVTRNYIRPSVLCNYIPNEIPPALQISRLTRARGNSATSNEGKM